MKIVLTKVLSFADPTKSQIVYINLWISNEYKGLNILVVKSQMFKTFHND